MGVLERARAINRRLLGLKRHTRDDPTFQPFDSGEEVEAPEFTGVPKLGQSHTTGDFKIPSTPQTRTGRPRTEPSTQTAPIGTFPTRTKRRQPGLVEKERTGRPITGGVRNAASQDFKVEGIFDKPFEKKGLDSQVFDKPFTRTGGVRGAASEDFSNIPLEERFGERSPELKQRLFERFGNKDTGAFGHEVIRGLDRRFIDPLTFEEFGTPGEALEGRAREPISTTAAKELAGIKEAGQTKRTTAEIAGRKDVAGIQSKATLGAARARSKTTGAPKTKRQKALDLQVASDRSIKELSATDTFKDMEPTQQKEAIANVRRETEFNIEANEKGYQWKTFQGTRYRFDPVGKIFYNVLGTPVGRGE